VGSLTGRGYEKFAPAALVLALAGLIAEIRAGNAAHWPPQPPVTGGRTR
jgi:hypothetical protein